MDTIKAQIEVNLNAAGDAAASGSLAEARRRIGLADAMFVEHLAELSVTEGYAALRSHLSSIRTFVNSLEGGA